MKLMKKVVHSVSSLCVRNFAARLLLRRQILLCAFSYIAQFHSAHSPTALNLIPCILLQRLLSLFECLIIYVKVPFLFTYNGTTFPQAPPLIPPAPPSPFPLQHCQSPYQLVAWGRGSPTPRPNDPPPQTLDGQLRSPWMGGGGV